MYHAECQSLSLVMLSVIMPNVVQLNFIILNVIMSNVIELNVIMPNVIMLNGLDCKYSTRVEVTNTLSLYDRKKVLLDKATVAQKTASNICCLCLFNFK